ncbi:MAG: hypothetical protein M5R36_23200 [Deltaproteobacteria bacterium]|nr:hypothetical protein [Deltaproteobacteria bacterium]
MLEAENLIEDHLKAAGKSRYIIVDDEFSMPGRIYAFLRNIVALDDKIHLRLSPAFDPFGNDVDDDGQSLDAGGRAIEIERYFQSNGAVARDEARDREFTRLLGERVVESFLRDTVISSTHALAWCVFEKLRALNPDPDFYRFLREAAYDISLPMVDIYRDLERIVRNVQKLGARGRLRPSPMLAQGDVEAIVDKALWLFSSYHTKPVLRRRGDRLFPGDMNLFVLLPKPALGVRIGENAVTGETR